MTKEYKTMSNKSPLKDFLISYSRADRLWAEWIAWQLEQEGYLFVIQTLDFRPGQDFVQSLQDAVRDTGRTIAVLSPDYLNELEKHSEWTAVLIPISVLRDHSKMGEVSYRTETLRVGFQLIESLTHLINHGIKRGKSEIRELFFA